MLKRGVDEEIEGSDGSCEGTADTTMLVQIEEVKFAIRKLPFVTILSPVRAVGYKGRGWQASLACYGCQEYGSCGKRQEPPIQLSRDRKTEIACLQELLKRLQDPSRHGKCAGDQCCSNKLAYQKSFLITNKGFIC